MRKFHKTIIKIRNMTCNLCIKPKWQASAAREPGWSLSQRKLQRQLLLIWIQRLTAVVKFLIKNKN